MESRNVRFSFDREHPLADDPGSGHNRWHPDLDPIASVSAGETITLPTRDGFDGQLGPDSSDRDVANLSFGRGHPLTGPLAVRGASPGDLLEVEFLEYDVADFGFTIIHPEIGLLADRYPGPRLIPWHIEDGIARSPSLPGVSVPVRPFAGIVGVAPSTAFLGEAAAREGRLARAGGLVAEPDPTDAIPSEAAAGLRTIPPRENGGNLDIPQLVAGSRLLLPVQQPGALLSVGDLHASQGEGECCGSALEVAGAVTLRVRVHTDPAWRPNFPAFFVPAAPARASLATTGIPLTDSGDNAMLDLNMAARQAVIELIDLLVEILGVPPEDAYALCSVAADLRITEVVNAPNSLVSALLPLDVFDTPPWPLDDLS
jgi:formamidase